MAKRGKKRAKNSKKRRRSDALSTFKTGGGAAKRSGESNDLLNFNNNISFNICNAKTRGEKRRKKRVFKVQNGF